MFERRRSTRDGVPIRVQLLRGFALYRGGGQVEVPPAAQRVIAFLALEGRRVNRLAVSGTLWLDAGEERAGASLRTALWRLGQVAGDVVRGEGLTLGLAGEVKVDFNQVYARANLLASQPEEHCERDLELLGVTGDLLPDWYDDWVLIERERLRQARLHALESLCRSLAAAGDYARAVHAGLMAVRVEPLRESSYRALIAAHAAQGNAAEGLRHYALYKRRMADELGLAPSAKMEMLVSRLRSG